MQMDEGVREKRTPVASSPYPVGRRRTIGGNRQDSLHHLSNRLDRHFPDVARQEIAAKERKMQASAEPLPTRAGVPPVPPGMSPDLDRLTRDFRQFIADFETLLKNA